MSKKYRTLVGPNLTIKSEASIFNNILSLDFDATGGFISNKKEIIYENEKLAYITDFSNSSNIFLSIYYFNNLINGYRLNGKTYTVVQKNIIQGHLLAKRGYVLNDYWDDTAFEIVDVDTNGNLLLTPGYVSSLYPYNNISQSELQRLEVLYNAGTNINEPIYYANHNPETDNFIYVLNDYWDNITYDAKYNPKADIFSYVLSDYWDDITHEAKYYSSYSYSSEADIFIFVKYNPDMPFVNTYYLGETGPLQHFMIPSSETQPYIHSITVTNFDRTVLKEYYLMYYGLNIAGKYEANKIYKVEKYINDSIYSTFYYEYNENAEIISIREEIQ